MGRPTDDQTRDGLSVTFGLVRGIEQRATERLPNMARCF